MKLLRIRADLDAALGRSASAEQTIGLVPTMGALHEGHLSLVRASRRRCDVTIASIFVNPLQFGAGEDLERYPRDEERDVELLRAEGVDIVFSPSVETMYPPGYSTRVVVGGPATVLEGQSRPGHFEGVATVVAKLINLVGPDVAFFGQKDAQQVAVVRAMLRDLDLAVEVVACPTVREADGLALSSRNVYLSAAERADAVVLYRALDHGRTVLAAGGTVSEAERAVRTILDTCRALEVDYAVAVDPDTFGPPTDPGPVLLAVAARLGRTRLIDNVLVER